MTEKQRDRLLDAWAGALSRSVPKFDHAGVRRRVLEAHARASQPRAFPAAFRWAHAGAALAVAAVVVTLLSWPATTFQVADHSGQLGTLLSAPPTRKLALSFSEGSQVSLAVGSSGRVTRLTHAGARVELERGSVNAHVAHRPGTDWSFGAGPFEVAVVGTNLEVSWSPDAGQFELSVSQGAVLVRGPFIEGAQEVRAGQVCRVDLTRRLMELGRLTSAPKNEASKPEASSTPAPPAPRAQQAASTPVASTPVASTPVASTPVASTDSGPASWLTLARSGKHREAVAAAERAGLANLYRSEPADSLLELARAARLAGRSDLERALLLACRKRAPGQSAAAQAAYLLGRASPPAQAAEWFEAYLSEEPRGMLAREASGRLIESYAAAGNRSAARQAASRYLAAYPHGPHASMARQALGAGRESPD